MAIDPIDEEALGVKKSVVLVTASGGVVIKGTTLTPGGAPPAVIVYGGTRVFMSMARKLDGLHVYMETRPGIIVESK